MSTYISRIRKFFPPVVTGTVVLAIGISLLPQVLTISQVE
ncbi:solute carrier family 23 protein [Paraclostridium bifermentans]|nr:solute carrier family 23 protein [Paraclostridium bifermentans]